MSLYINKEKNSMIFNSKDFEINKNVIPDIFMGMREMDEKKTIHFAVDLEKTPIIFVLYFQKIQQESEADLRIYYRENTESLRAALQIYSMQYKSIKDYWDYRNTDAYQDQFQQGQTNSQEADLSEQTA